MDMPTQYSKDSLEPVLKNFKPEVINLPGYVAPPQGDFVAKLNQNENPYDLPPELKEEIFETMQKIVWSRYPDYFNTEFREKLAEHWNIEPEQILPSNGSNQMLYAIASALIMPGDRALVSTPSFSLFDLVIKIHQGRLERIDQNDGFLNNEETLLKASRESKLTFLCSPNNPTGQTTDFYFLKQLLEETPGLVLWDEAYAEFIGNSAVPMLKAYPNLLVLRTFSKAFGMAGLRVGYLLGNPMLLSEIQKVSVPYNLNLFSQTTALVLLNHSEWVYTQIQKIIDERNLLFEELERIPQITPVPSEANFILIKTPDAPSVFNELKLQGVLIREVENHPLLKNCLRVTVGKPEENQIFIDALKQIVSNL
jgi:histidinol-phosphate aminotransferase